MKVGSVTDARFQRYRDEELVEPNGFDVHQSDEFSPLQEIALDSEDALAILIER